MKAHITIPSDFGDNTKYKSIDYLVDYFNENSERTNQYKYIVKLINEYNVLIKSLNVLDKKKRLFFLELLKKDTIERVKHSKLIENEKLTTYFLNLIVSMNKNEADRLRKELKIKK